MITLQGSAQRTYVFPADRPTAYAFYADLSRVLTLLDYISIADRFSEKEYRLAYQATELGLYHVSLTAISKPVLTGAITLSGCDLLKAKTLFSPALEPIP